MKTKFLFFVVLTILLNFQVFSEAKDYLNDPREIIIKPKAVNGFFFFITKYTSNDFKLFMKKALQDGTADPKLKSLDLTENSVIHQLNYWEAQVTDITIFDQWHWMGGLDYHEYMAATIINMESKQEFNVILHPALRKAFLPNITIGKYKFEKITLTLDLGSYGIFNSEVKIGQELPEFTINSNTALIYGMIDLRGGEIKYTNEEKSMKKLRDYVDLMKKFRKNDNLKLVELTPDKDTDIKLTARTNTDKNNNENERMAILNMLRENKITPQEAEKLLKVLK